MANFETASIADAVQIQLYDPDNPITAGPGEAVITSIADTAAALDGVFDADAYRAAHPDVAAAGVDPLTHFLEFGEDEMLRGDRNYDGVGFDAAYYAEANPDVAAAVERGDFASGFHHYMAFGAAEGRAPRALEASTPTGVTITIDPNDPNTHFVDLIRTVDGEAELVGSFNVSRAGDQSIESLADFIDDVLKEFDEALAATADGDTIIITDPSDASYAGTTMASTEIAFPGEPAQIAIRGVNPPIPVEPGVSGFSFQLDPDDPNVYALEIVRSVGGEDAFLLSFSFEPGGEETLEEIADRLAAELEDLIPGVMVELVDGTITVTDPMGQIGAEPPFYGNSTIFGTLIVFDGRPPVVEPFGGIDLPVEPAPSGLAVTIDLNDPNSYVMDIVRTVDGVNEIVAGISFTPNQLETLEELAERIDAALKETDPALAAVLEGDQIIITDPSGASYAETIYFGTLMAFDGRPPIVEPFGEVGVLETLPKTDSRLFRQGDSFAEDPVLVSDAGAETVFDFVTTPAPEEGLITDITAIPAEIVYRTSESDALPSADEAGFFGEANIVVVVSRGEDGPLSRIFVDADFDGDLDVETDLAIDVSGIIPDAAALNLFI